MTARDGIEQADYAELVACFHTALAMGDVLDIDEARDAAEVCAGTLLSEAVPRDVLARVAIYRLVKP